MKTPLMKTTGHNKRKLSSSISLFIFTIFFYQCHGLRDLTVEYEFGCTWLGGSMSGTLTCSCFEGAKEMYLQKGDLPSFDTSAIHIENCNSVRFGSETISASRNLRTIELININNLSFEEGSLFWDGYSQTANAQTSDFADRTMPGLRIVINNSIVQDISRYSFKGRYNEIIFKNVVIENVAPFAFTSLSQVVKVDFSDTTFRSIRPQAFKKFSTDNLLLSDVTFDNVPSRAFSEITVLEKFSIHNCKFGRVNPSGFIIKDPKFFDIINSQFNILDGDAFKVTTRGDVSVKDSIFNVTNGGAFLGIELNTEQIFVQQKFIFDNDVFNALHGDTLSVNTRGFQPIYNNIFLNQQCDCWYIDRVLEDNRFYEEIKCLLEDGENITMKEFKSYNCTVISRFSIVIIVVFVVLILLVIIVSAVVFYMKRVYRGTKQKEYISDKNGKPLGLILPDGRTYRETELHVVVERADLLTTDL